MNLITDFYLVLISSEIFNLLNFHSYQPQLRCSCGAQPNCLNQMSAFDIGETLGAPSLWIWSILTLEDFYIYIYREFYEVMTVFNHFIFWWHEIHRPLPLQGDPTGVGTCCMWLINMQYQCINIVLVAAFKPVCGCWKSVELYGME